MKIVYSFLVMDLPHWGHILHLKKARALGDILIVGILDDDTVKQYKRMPIMKLEQRMKIASQIKGVDLVIPQLFNRFPIENLMLLHKLFPKDKIICVHADDWKREDFETEETFLKSIGGELILLPYYEGEDSTSTLIQRVKDGDY